MTAAGSLTLLKSPLEVTLSKLLRVNQINDPNQQVYIINDNAKLPTLNLVQDALDHLHHSSTSSSSTMGGRSGASFEEEFFLFSEHDVEEEEEEDDICDDDDDDPFADVITITTEASSINTSADTPTPTMNNKSISCMPRDQEQAPQQDSRWGEKKDDSQLLASPSPSCFKKLAVKGSPGCNVRSSSWSHHEDSANTKGDKLLVCPSRRSSSHHRRTSLTSLLKDMNDEYFKFENDKKQKNNKYRKQSDKQNTVKRVDSILKQALELASPTTSTIRKTLAPNSRQTSFQRLPVEKKDTKKHHRKEEKHNNGSDDDDEDTVMNSVVEGISLSPPPPPPPTKSRTGSFLDISTSTSSSSSSSTSKKSANSTSVTKRQNNRTSRRSQSSSSRKKSTVDHDKNDNNNNNNNKALGSPRAIFGKRRGFKSLVEDDEDEPSSSQ